MKLFLYTECDLRALKQLTTGRRVAAAGCFSGKTLQKISIYCKHLQIGLESKLQSAILEMVWTRREKILSRPKLTCTFCLRMLELTALSLPKSKPWGRTSPRYTLRCPMGSFVWGGALQEYTISCPASGFLGSIAFGGFGMFYSQNLS